jgi:Helix-turn-helix domain
MFGFFNLKVILGDNKMSWKVGKSVLLYSKTKANERVVMLVLADFADDKSYLCYPSIETIAKLANIDDSTVKRILPKLVKLGELEYDSGAKKNRTNIYKILLPRYEPQSKFAQESSNSRSRKFEQEMSHSEYNGVANLQDSSRNSATQTTNRNNIETHNEQALRECSKCNSLAKSRYTHEQCLSFAKHLSITSTIRTPAGFAVSIHRSGSCDYDIEVFLRDNDSPRTKSIREIVEEKLKLLQQSQDD